MRGDNLMAGNAGSLAAAALLLLHAGLAWVLRVPALTTAQDDAVYLLLARALRHFSYVDLWLVGTPFESLYPPLYPALLASATAIFGDRFAVAIAASVLLSTATLGLFYLIVRRWSPGLALLCLAVAAVNPTLLNAAGHVQSEPLFMCFAALSLWCLTAPAPTRRTQIAAGAFAIAAALTRSVGIALLLAILGQWLLERRFRAAGWFALASLLTVGAWMTWTAVAPRQLAGQSYITDAAYIRTDSVTSAPAPPAASHDSAPAVPSHLPLAPSKQRARGVELLRTVASRLTNNVPTYLARRIPMSLAMPTIGGTRIDNWGWLLIVLGAGTVGFTLLARRLPGVALYFFFYAGILAIWPYILPRFLVPVIGLLVLIVLAGGQWLGARWSPRVGWGIAVMLAGVLGVSGLLRDRVEWRALSTCDRSAPYVSTGCFPAQQLAFFSAVHDAGRRTPADAVLLTPKAATTYLLIGRRTVNELEAASLPPAEMQEYLRRLGVQYILLSHVHRDQWVIAGRLIPYCASLELVEQYGGDALLLRRHEAEFAGGNACEALKRFAGAPWQVGRRGPRILEAGPREFSAGW